MYIGSPKNGRYGISIRIELFRQLRRIFHSPFDHQSGDQGHSDDDHQEEDHLAQQALYISLFYGHVDVLAAEVQNTDCWHADAAEEQPPGKKHNH